MGRPFPGPPGPCTSSGSQDCSSDFQEFPKTQAPAQGSLAPDFHCSVALTLPAVPRPRAYTTAQNNPGETHPIFPWFLITLSAPKDPPANQCQTPPHLGSLSLFPQAFCQVPAPPLATLTPDPHQRDLSLPFLFAGPPPQRCPPPRCPACPRPALFGVSHKIPAPPSHYRKCQGAHRPGFKCWLYQPVCTVSSDYGVSLSEPQFPVLEKEDGPSENYSRWYR